MKKIILGVCLFVVSLGSFAQSENYNGQSVGWNYAVSGTNLYIASESAVRERIGDTALGLNFLANYNNKMWLVSMGVDVYFLTDKDSFSQETTNALGDDGTSESSANAYDIFFAVGPQLRLGEKQNINIYAQAGLGKIFSASRSIGNCTNCYSENIDIDGGLFAKFGANFGSGPSKFGIYLQQYLSSEDLDRAIGVSWVWGL